MIKKAFIGIYIIFLANNLYCQLNQNPYLFNDEILKFNIQTRCILNSFIGNYQNALSGYEDENSCKASNYLISGKDSLDFVNCSPIDASQYILEKAKKVKVILINEGHNIPPHRAFTLSLLQELYNSGFRYFGAETFNNHFVKVPFNQIGDKFYPINKTGYYSREPIFGDLVREALRIGFTIFAYEDTSKNSVVQKNGFINEDLSRRDYNMALNIKKILDKDSSAKIIIHAGYGHIVEEKGAMGGELKKLTGINPLSIDQSTMTERALSECENPYFKMINIQKPTIYIHKSNDSVFLDNSFRNRPDIKTKNRLDIEVFHPRTTYINKRPDWLYMNGQRKAFNLDEKYLILGYPILVFAYYADENTDEAIPIDVFEIKSKDDIKPLVLPQGRFNIIFKNKENKIVKYQIENEK